MTTESVEDLLRELAPQVLAAVVRRHGDLATAEDAVQVAVLGAATEWPKGGVPQSPRGWLIHVASRRVIDYVRSDVARRRREELAVAQNPPMWQPAPATDAEHPADRDDTLSLLFMCCHPVLTPPSAIALTLRASVA